MNILSVGVGSVGASIGFDTPGDYYRARAWWFSYGPAWQSWRLTVVGICLIFWRH